MRRFIWIMVLGLGYSNTTVSPNVYSAGIRETNQYRVWIYFDNKDSDKPININAKTVARRLKHGKAPSNWYDIPVKESYLEILENNEITIIHTSRWLNAVSALVSDVQIQQLSHINFISKIEPVITYRMNKPVDLNPAGYRANSRSDTSFYGVSWDQIEQIQVHTAHENSFTGSGVRILVMDTGFWLEHQAFDRLNVIAQWDVINDDSVCANETDLETAWGQDRHGSMVLSAMAGYWPDTLIGPAYNAEFLLAKTEDVTQEIELEEDNYVAGLEWGEANGADVVSTSLGYLDWYTYCDLDGETAVTTNAIDIAAGLGMVCVTAMGNEGGYSPPGDPCNDPITYYMIAPADADSVIAVGAVDQNGLIAGFSSHGPTWDGRIKPEVCARGYYTYCISPHTSTFTVANGTSLSTPLVGGVAAIILSAHPDWTAIQVREALMMTATQAENPDNDYGWGIVQTWDAIQYESTQTTNPFTPIKEGYEISSIYPNPFNGRFTIRVSAKSENPISIKLYDINGRFIQELYNGKINSNAKELSMESNGLTSGVYVLAIDGDEGSHYRKITIIK